MTSTDSNFKPLAMPVPFAGGEGAARAVIHTDNEGENANEVNYFDGFPAIYSADIEDGGKYVTRDEMNAVGYMATASAFYGMAGGLNTFDQQFASMIGGYPKGAVLDYEKEDGAISKIISAKDDNISVPSDTIGTDWCFLSQKSNTMNNIFYYEYPGKFGSTMAIRPREIEKVSSGSIFRINNMLALGYPYDASWNCIGEFTAKSNAVINLSTYANIDASMFESANATISKYDIYFTGYGVSACITQSGASMTTDSSYLAISSVGTCTFAKSNTSNSTTTYSSFTNSFTATANNKYKVFLNVSPLVMYYYEESTGYIYTCPVSGYASDIQVMVF